MRVGEPGTVAKAPLSHTQARVWFLQHVDPTGAAYNVAAIWYVDGPLDVAALRAALHAVAVRQPMLRTRFPTIDGVPCQVVGEGARVDLELVDLAEAGDAADDRMREAARELASWRFDLATAPPIRWTLFALGRDRHALVRVWHHVLGDALSGRAMNDDLARAYASARAGATPALPPLPVDYLSYSERQRRELESPDAARRLEACRARLAGAPTLALPTDFRRPASPSFRGGEVRATLPPAAADALRSAARSAGVSTSAAFLGAYAALMSRLAGETDVVIGMPVAARPLPELVQTVGFFANTAACRLDLAGASVHDAFRRAYAATRDAIASEQVPFDRLVDALGLARDASRNPLFQVAFGMIKRSIGDLALEGCAVRREEIGLGHARFDLTLTLYDGGAGAEVEAYWGYATDLFDRATVERMARQYGSLVDAMTREPGRSIASLPLMDDAARRTVVAWAAGTPTPAPPVPTIAAAFEAQAAAAPSAPAIGALDYGTLDAAANRLGGELLARGVARGSFVAVARADPADLAIAWLAVLKAGAAYLPVDADVPAERLAQMLASASVTHAIADDAIAPRLARPGLDVLCPAREAARIDARAALAPTRAPSPRDPAYVIYTSGSTGRPKGVVVPHEAVVRLVCNTDYVRLGPSDVVAQLANPAFDASTFEVWGALLNGARLAPIPKATAIAPRALASEIARQRVTTLFVTTALFEAVAREAPDAFSGCRTVLFGGEAATPSRVARVLGSKPPSRLVHVYGPTETTTFATWHEVREVPDRAATVPIGRAIANAEVVVLRADGKPAAPGEPGEIVIGGAGLALGYLGASDRDEARFVVAPAGDLPARRLYRTGDRARWRDDGTIEFLGRADGQVKVRGHRIELAEVEAAIAREPGVRDVAAILAGEASDTRRIVAYVVPADPSAPPPAGLRRALRLRLPPAMLPSEIVWIPSLPLNANGKVDRKALPSADAAPVESTGAHVPPRDPLEADLVRRFEDALGRRGIGIHDRFFDLGGHSLLAARVADDYERETGVRLPLTALFVDDTVAHLADAIRMGSLAAHAEIAPLHERGTRTPFVYVHGDFMAAGFHTHALARLLGPDQPVYAVHPHGLADRSIPTSIEAMAADRLRVLRGMRPHGPYVVGGHCNGAFVAFELAGQLIDAGEEVPAVIVVDASAPGAIGGGTPDEAAVSATLASLGFAGANDRMSDLAHRLYRAMLAYRGRRLDTHLLVVRSGESGASAHDEGWRRLARTAEVQVLPGDHKSLVTDENALSFAAAIRGVIDRAAADRARAPPAS